MACSYLLSKVGISFDESTVTFALDGYTVHLALSIFCSLKLASSALLYVLLQLTQNLASLTQYIDRNVLVDWQRGQFVNLGFDSNVKNIVNSLFSPK